MRYLNLAIIPLTAFGLIALSRCTTTNRAAGGIADHDTPTRSACLAGQMTQLTQPVNIFQKSPDGREVQQARLEPGTTVHVVAQNKIEIEIYVHDGSSGNMVSGLGKVPINEPKLSCQN